jgi:hypothetical protein
MPDAPPTAQAVMTDRHGAKWYTTMEIARDLHKSVKTIRRALRPYRDQCRLTRTQKHPRRLLVMPESIALQIVECFRPPSRLPTFLPAAAAQPIPDALANWATDLREVDSVPGVYFLVVGEQVMYVGASRNVHRRLADHKHLGRTWDKAFVMVLPIDKIHAVEGQFIRRLLPPWNGCQRTS